jgi:small subunit ribosomal protein S21
VGQALQGQQEVLDNDHFGLEKVKERIVEGIFREMKRRKAYEKPSERKTREKAEAIRRARKAARKLAQREGLIPMPKRPTLNDQGATVAKRVSAGARDCSDHDNGGVTWTCSHL